MWNSRRRSGRQSARERLVDFSKDPIGYLHGRIAPSCYKELLYVSVTRLLFRENCEPSRGGDGEGDEDGARERVSLTLGKYFFHAVTRIIKNDFGCG